MASYEEKHRLISALAARDTGNNGWQRDLIVSYWKLAGLADQQGKTELEIDHWQSALAIARELEASGRLAPRDAYIPGAIDERLMPLIEAAAGQ